MMWGVTATAAILCTFFFPAHAGDLATGDVQNELVQRALNTWPLPSADLDDTVFGKAEGPPLPEQACCSCPGCNDCSEGPDDSYMPRSLKWVPWSKSKQKMRRHKLKKLRKNKEREPFGFGKVKLKNLKLLFKNATAVAQLSANQTAVYQAQMKKISKKLDRWNQVKRLSWRNTPIKFKNITMKYADLKPYDAILKPKHLNVGRMPFFEERMFGEATGVYAKPFGTLMQGYNKPFFHQLNRTRIAKKVKAPKGNCCAMCDDLAHTSPDVVSIQQTALIGLVVGSGAIFVLLRFRRVATNIDAEPFLGP